MSIKDRCILVRIIELAERGVGGDLFTKLLTRIYNQGERFVSDMVFTNDDDGIRNALGWLSDSDAKYFISQMETGEGPHYSRYDDLVTFDSGIRSLDFDEFRDMLTPDKVDKIVNDEAIVANLDNSDYLDAFETYIRVEYPDRMKYWDADWEERHLYDTDFRTADWDQLAQTLGGNTMQLSESDLRMMTNRILKEVIKRRKK